MTTWQIFSQNYKEMIAQSFQGYNVTIFAYGQTASGKTYTMHGNVLELINEIKSK